MILISYFLMLTVGIVSVSQTEAETCPYDNPGCTCSGSTITCDNLQTLPPLKTGSNVTSFKILYFNSGQVANIPNNSLPAGLTYIYFNFPLTNISDDAFLTSATTLKDLEFQSPKFRRLPWALLKLTSLTDFEITDTYIEMWDNAILQHLAQSVTYLELKNVGLSAWPTWLSLFYSLQGIYLSNNMINYIPDDAFIQLQSTLQHLELSNTSLTEVPRELSVLRGILFLDLGANRITDEDGRLQASFPFKTLQTLYLGSTGLSLLPDLSNLTDLYSLDLSYNQLTDVAQGSIPSSLQTLYLSNNKLTKVPDIITTLSNLRLLYLQINGITEINFDNFPQSLNTLYLSYNKITKITESSKNASFGYLDLSYNPISVISPSAFTNFPQLEYLFLSYTDLTQIPIAVTFLTRLNNLVLSPPSLICPCPPLPEFLQWYQSYHGTLSIDGDCGSSKPIDQYLSHSCSKNVSGLSLNSEDTI